MNNNINILLIIIFLPFLLETKIIKTNYFKIMANIIIYNISGSIFLEINYTDINELNEKLKLIITNYDSDLYVQLLINENILNNFNIIDISILLNLTKNDFITIVFNQKKEMYCLNNENGKYILDNKQDNYSKLLEKIISYYENKSYDIIKNNSYKEIVLKAVKKDGYSLIYTINLQNDKEVVLEAVKQNGNSLNFANINLQNDKEVVLEAVKQNGNSLNFASSLLQNDKEVVLKAVKQNGNALLFVSTNLQNNKEVVLNAIKQNCYALSFASIDLQNDKEIVLEAVKQNGFVLKYASIDLKNNKEIVTAAIKQNIKALKFASIDLQNSNKIE